MSLGAVPASVLSIVVRLCCESENPISTLAIWQSIGPEFRVETLQALRSILLDLAKRQLVVESPVSDRWSPPIDVLLGTVRQDEVLDALIGRTISDQYEGG